jgi:hypothetical protein
MVSDRIERTATDWPRPTPRQVRAWISRARDRQTDARSHFVISPRSTTEEVPILVAERRFGLERTTVTWYPAWGIEVEGKLQYALYLPTPSSPLKVLWVSPDQEGRTWRYPEMKN